MRQAFAAIDWTKVHSLHAYRPIRNQREVDTAAFIEMVSEQYPHINIATWKKAANTFVACWLDTDTPVPSAHRFDLIIVPLLGFNDSLHRLGFGGGFYDRYLPTQSDAITVGLCYEAGRTEIAFQESHDVPLFQIVTETNHYINETASHA